jgi:hypothetical protein
MRANNPKILIPIALAALLILAITFSLAGSGEAESTVVNYS